MERNYAELDSQRSREIEQIREELKTATESAKRFQEERDTAVQHQKELSHNFEDASKRLASKQIDFESLTKDYAQLQGQHRNLMSSEGNLQTSKEQLEAQKRIKADEATKLKQEIEKAQALHTAEKNDMSQKLQDLLMHNEKVKDDCLKKVLVYKDKYTDYKNKVKAANQQINLLTQRVARFELERG